MENPLSGSHDWANVLPDKLEHVFKKNLLA